MSPCPINGWSCPGCINCHNPLGTPGVVAYSGTPARDIAVTNLDAAITRLSASCGGLPMRVEMSSRRLPVDHDFDRTSEQVFRSIAEPTDSEALSEVDNDRTALESSYHDQATALLDLSDEFGIRKAKAVDPLKAEREASAEWVVWIETHKGSRNQSSAIAPAFRQAVEHLRSAVAHADRLTLRVAELEARLSDTTIQTLARIGAMGNR